jgi:hypothetical protein
MDFKIRKKTKTRQSNIRASIPADPDWHLWANDYKHAHY